MSPNTFDCKQKTVFISVCGFSVLSLIHTALLYSKFRLLLHAHHCEPKIIIIIIIIIILTFIIIIIIITLNIIILILFIFIILIITATLAFLPMGATFSTGQLPPFPHAPPTSDRLAEGNNHTHTGGQHFRWPIRLSLGRDGTSRTIRSQSPRHPAPLTWISPSRSGEAA